MKKILCVLQILFMVYISNAQGYVIPASRSTGVNTISSGSVTSAASGTIGIPSGYSHIHIEIYDVVPATSNVAMQVQVSADSSTFDASANNYLWTLNYVTSGAAIGPNASAGDTKIVISNAWGNTTAQAGNFQLLITDPRATAYNPSISWTASYYDNTGAVNAIRGAGRRANA